MITNHTEFTKDLQLWNNTASSFPDIYAEANNNDWFEWHVTISKISNGNEFKFHFMIFWHNGWFTSQPKICLLFGQRCMINCSNFYGNWLLLDKNITIFSVTAVLLGLRNIVRRIDVTNIDPHIFNSHNCIYCDYTRRHQVNTRKKALNIMKDDKNILSISNTSVSNSSMVSLTVSNCSDISVGGLEINNKEIDINLETKIPIIDNDAAEISTKSIVVSTSNNEKIKKSEDELISNTKINMIGKSISKPKPEIKSIKVSNNNEKINTSKPVLLSKTKINKSKKIITKPKVNPNVNKKTPKNNKKMVSAKNNKKTQEKKIEKEAVHYLDVDENGFLVWKWSEGRRPNQKISLNSSSKSFRWNNKKN